MMPNTVLDIGQHNAHADSALTILKSSQTLLPVKSFKKNVRHAVFVMQVFACLHLFAMLTLPADAHICQHGCNLISLKSHRGVRTGFILMCCRPGHNQDPSSRPSLLLHLVMDAVPISKHTYICMRTSACAAWSALATFSTLLNLLFLSSRNLFITWGWKYNRHTSQTCQHPSCFHNRTRRISVDVSAGCVTCATC